MTDDLLDPDAFRQLTFAESQVQVCLPPGARIVDLSLPDGGQPRLMVLNVTGVQLRDALGAFEVRDSAEWPGWLVVRVPGLSAGFDEALVTTGSNLVTVN